MKLSDAEWKVMNVLWERSPQSARDVLNAVEKETNWAYTTAKTMLSRLVVKGALREEKQGQAALYSPLVSRDGARSSAIRSLLDRAFGGETLPLVQNLLDVEKLSAEDRAHLHTLIDQAQSASRKRPS